MKTTYELWDTEGSNLIGTYPTPKAALHVVRNAVKSHGREAMATVALGMENEVGRTIPVAQGSKLVELAFRKDDGGTKSAIVIGFAACTRTIRSIVDAGRSTQVIPRRRRTV